MTSQDSNQGSADDNRYQLVNNIAKRAKILINHDTSAQLNNHRAIHEAMQQEEPVGPAVRKATT